MTQMPLRHADSNGSYSMGVVNQSRDYDSVGFISSYVMADPITIVGILLSIVFICVHLVVHCLSKKLHNLPGRNLASFCVSLMLQYGCILVSIVVEDYVCWLISALVNYFLMSSYVWMLMMSYDTWRTIRYSLHECILYGGDQWTRFFVYSCCSWCVPLFYSIAFDYAMPKYAFNFKELVDAKGCPVSDPLFTLLKRGSLLLILLANFVFFAGSLYYIYLSSRFEAFSSDHRRFMNHFALHVRLVLITGLTWAVEELTFFCGFEVLSLVFNFINMFQGLFIAVAFTCRKRVCHSIKVFGCV